MLNDSSINVAVSADCLKSGTVIIVNKKKCSEIVLYLNDRRTANNPVCSFVVTCSTF